jgi:hypothetical protein
MAERVDVGAEYGELVDAVHGRGKFLESSGGDAYQALMQKERRVLDTVDRVVNDANRTDADGRSFFQLPLHVIGIRIIAAIRGVMDDLLEARSPGAVYAAFMRDDRKVYIGVLMLVVAFGMAAVGNGRQGDTHR